MRIQGWRINASASHAQRDGTAMNTGKPTTVMNGTAFSRNLLVKTAERAENFRSRTGRVRAWPSFWWDQTP